MTLLGPTAHMDFRTTYGLRSKTYRLCLKSKTTTHKYFFPKFQPGVKSANVSDCAVCVAYRFSWTLFTRHLISYKCDNTFRMRGARARRPSAVGADTSLTPPPLIANYQCIGDTPNINLNALLKTQNMVLPEHGAMYSLVFTDARIKRIHNIFHFSLSTVKLSTDGNRC